MKIYIAGKAPAWPRLSLERDGLREMGFEVSSSWLDTGPDTKSKISLNADMDYNRKAAARDCKEVTEANMLILDTLDVSESGGREVELGIAMGQANKYIYIVGPIRNVFHSLHTRFNTWDELFNALEGLGK